MVEGQDDATESVPLFLPPLDFRGVYTRRYTYCFDTSGGTVSLYREMFFAKPPGITWNCLYDRQTDPGETNNLYASPQHREIREELHRQTLKWMRQCGDSGDPYRAVASTVFTLEDQKARAERKWDVFTGILKGSPLDLLNRNDGSSKH